jgi:hypothetical protein
MRRLLAIVAILTAVVSATGCSDQNRQSQAVISDLQKREKTLIEQCRKIATDRDILLAKLEAMKSVYDPSMKREPEPDRAHECTVSNETNVETGRTAPTPKPKLQTHAETGQKATEVKNFGECRDLDGAPCREFLTDEDMAAADRTLERKPARSLCWEGYCPCEPPQGGPDQLLCDALRRGDADPKMLSVGKSMRETRRQISEHQF